MSKKTQAAESLLDGASYLYLFRKSVKSALIAQGNRHGYQLRDAAFILGMSEIDLCNALYPDSRSGE